MTHLIRPGAAADREGIAAVIGSDASFTAEEQAVALELVDLAFGGSADYMLLVATSDQQLRGYICFGPTPMTQGTYDLYWIVVHEQARGQGLARALVTDMETYLRRHGGAHVRVETSETEGYGAARHLYTRLGYPEAARLGNFYAPGDALIIYYKEL